MFSSCFAPPGNWFQSCQPKPPPLRELRAFGQEARVKSKGYDETVLSGSLPSRDFYEALGDGSFEDRSIDVGDGERLEFWAARKPLTGNSS